MCYDNGMNQRISYYVSRKSFLVWLSAVLMVCSAIARIAYFCGKGADAATVWFQIVLPVTAALMYALMLLASGEERLYRTSVPVFLFALYFGLRISAIPGMWLRYILLCWIAYLAFAVAYAIILSGRRFQWLLPLIHLGGLGVLLYDSRAALHAGGIGVLYANLSDFLVLLAGLCAMCAVHIHLDNAYHPTWGDRADGRRLRTLDPVQVVANYIMPTRTGSSNFIRESVEITAIERYIREKRRAGMTNFGITHVFLAAYVRCVAKYPALNRFLSGQQVYTRDEDIQFWDSPSGGTILAAARYPGPLPGAADALRLANEKTVRRLTGARESGEPVRAWVFPYDAYDLCGLYFLCDFFRSAKTPLFLVELPTCEARDDNAWTEYRGAGDVPPERLGNALKNARPLSAVERTAYAMRWRELLAENAPLRASVNGRVMSVPADFYDFAIRRNLPEGKFVLAHVIGKTLADLPCVGDRPLYLRLKAMEARGEITLVTPAEKDDTPYAAVYRKA